MIKCNNCNWTGNEDDLESSWPANHVLSEPAWAICPDCKEPWEGEEVEPKLRCNFCKSLVSKDDINWRKPFIRTPEDPEPHCPDCGRSEGFEEDDDDSE